MSIELTLKSAAKDIVAKFTLGNMTLTKVTGNAYNTTTGTYTETTSTVSVPGVLDEIDVMKYEKSYAEKHFLCILDGVSLAGVVPKVGDYITIPAGTKHKVVHKETDQYAAAYFLHLSEQPA